MADVVMFPFHKITKAAVKQAPCKLIELAHERFYRASLKLQRRGNEQHKSV